MKILMLNYEYPPVGGGAGNATYYFLREASKSNDVEIDLITSSPDSELHIDQPYSNITIHRLPIGKNEGNLNFGSNRDLINYSKAAILYALKLHKKRNFDLTHAFFSVPCGFLALILKFLKGIPYIVSLRGADVPGYKKRYEKLDKYIFSWLNQYFIWKFSKKVIANSSALRELALKTSPKQNIKIIPNGIDIDFYQPNFDKSFDIIKINTGWTRLESRKAIDLLIKAFAQLKKDFVNIQLEIPGTGKELDNLKDLARELDIADSVVFYEIASNDDESRKKVAKILANSHILCLPSRNEGMSNAVLEGLACGLPVILTDVGGTAELLVEGVNGYKINIDDKDDIYIKLKKIIKDKENILTLGRASYSKAQNMSWENVFEQYLNEYQYAKRIVI